MDKKKISLICLVFIVPLVIIWGIYLLLSFYYKDTFILGTWINGQYCTGMSVDEVNLLLIENAEVDVPVITITDPEGNYEEIYLDEEMYSVNYTLQLQTLLQQQDSFKWLFELDFNKNNEISPQLSYDNEAILAEIEQLLIIQEAENAQGATAEIVWTDEGFILEQETGVVPNKNKITSQILSDLEKGVWDIEISRDCYEEQVSTPEMEETLALWEKVEQLQNCGIIYDMGDEQVPIDASVVANWILTDNSGKIKTNIYGEVALRDGCFAEFINNLAAEYDTSDVSMNFLTTRGDVVTIDKNSFGKCIDKEVEAAYLKEAFIAGLRVTHTPTYTNTSLNDDEDGVGDTYVEIDLSEEMLYYYDDGDIIIESPFTMGDLSEEVEIPECICYVYDKEKDRLVRGNDYSVHVDYWIPVIGSIGIHDAIWSEEWEEEFYDEYDEEYDEEYEEEWSEEDIYDYAEFYGYINIPHETMEELYDLVKTDTPVVMFY